MADWQARSEAARVSLGQRVRGLPGGSLLVPAAAGAPLLVFVHGGYWQALSASESLYLAPPAVALGWSYAAVEYTIAPAGDLPTMIDEVAVALRSAVEAAEPRAVVLVGHSAGAHLVSMVALAHEPPVPVTRAVLLSGVYDLRPIVMTTVNDPLGLDLTAAERLSPMLLPTTSAAVGPSPEVTVAWGDADTDAFEAQSTAYAAVLRRAGLEVAALRCEGRHHFDIVDDIVDPATELGALTLGGLT